MPPRARLPGRRRGAPSPRILRPLLLPPRLVPHQHHVPVQLHLRLLRQVLRLRVRLSARPLSVPQSARLLAWMTPPLRRPSRLPAAAMLAVPPLGSWTRSS